MNPLQIRVLMGLEDDRLLEHIHLLEAHKSGQTASHSISPGEQLTLDTLYARLEILTNAHHQTQP